VQRLDGSYPNEKYYFDFRSYTFIYPDKQIYICIYLFIEIDSPDRNLGDGFMIYSTIKKKKEIIFYYFYLSIQTKNPTTN